MTEPAAPAALIRWRTKGDVDVSLSHRAVAEAIVFGAASGAVATVVSGMSVILGAALGLTISLLALASSLIHELAHLRAARRRGLRVLRLEVTGALSGRLTREASVRPRTEMVICLAGPIATVALLGVALIAVVALRDGPSFARGVAVTMATLNLAALAGTVPIVPGSDVSRAWSAWRQKPDLA